MEFLRKSLYPLSLVYGGVTYLRNRLYDRGIFHSEPSSTPTVCVGNLSVGGTGKTPMVEYLVRRLGERHRLAILSRGYRREGKGFLLARPGMGSRELGDEPAQLFAKFPEVPLAVDADRRRGIRALEAMVAPGLILLDDAFQHRRVRPTFSMLLTAYDRPFDRDGYLPYGTLRDHRHEVTRADVVIVTKCPGDLGDESREDFRKRFVQAGLQPERTPILFATLAYEDAWVGPNGKVSHAEWEGVRGTLVTGIARPGPLVRHLEELGLRFDHLRFPDHHPFGERDIARIRAKRPVWTTEKDYTRLRGQVPEIHYLRVSHRFLGDDALVLDGLLDGMLND